MCNYCAMCCVCGYIEAKEKGYEKLSVSNYVGLLDWNYKEVGKGYIEGVCNPEQCINDSPECKACENWFCKWNWDEICKTEKLVCPHSVAKCQVCILERTMYEASLLKTK